MSTISTLTMTAALLASLSTAAPLSSRAVTAPFNLTSVPAAGGYYTQLFACHSGAGLSVICANGEGAGPAYEFDYDTNTSELELAPSGSGATTYEGALFTQQNGTVTYASFGYSEDITTVIFNSEGEASVPGGELYLCPYSTNAESEAYSALGYVADGDVPNEGCEEVVVSRVFGSPDSVPATPSK